MLEKDFHLWAEEVAGQTSFESQHLIYTGRYYSHERVRDVIYKGIYQGRKAVLKLYDDPRVTDEPRSLQSFLNHNQSTVLTAPQLYAYEMMSPKKGWLIMECLPEGGCFLQVPLSPLQRKECIDLYQDYRNNFPSQPTRPLSLSEQLPADEYHLIKLGKWFQLANDKEEERRAAGEELVLHPDEILPRYRKVLSRIREEFAKRPMRWCHGHFNPKELYKTDDGKRCYLTDFAHTKMYPEGYELAFMIWADHLMGADWRQEYLQWKQGVDDWKNDLEPMAHASGIDDFHSLIDASLLERSMGSILADVIASDRSMEEKKGRLKLLYQLIDDLLDV